jgi:hypothetical protein
MSKHNLGSEELSAAQILGGCETKPRRKAGERLLEKKVFDFFVGAGELVWRQVDCGFAGVADVVTKDAIYELKDRLPRRSYQQALGQLQLYKNYLNPCARMGIICNGTNMSPRKLEKLESLTGVAVLVWQDPPYQPRFRRSDPR